MNDYTLTQEQLQNLILKNRKRLKQLADAWDNELDGPHGTEEQRAVGILIQSVDDYLTRLINIHEVKFGELQTNEWEYYEGQEQRRIKDSDILLYCETKAGPDGKFLYGVADTAASVYSQGVYCGRADSVENGKRLALEAFQQGLKL